LFSNNNKKKGFFFFFEKIKKKKEKRKKKKEKRKKELVAKHTRCEHLLQLHVGGLLHNYGTMILTTNSPFTTYTTQLQNAYNLNLIIILE